MKIFWLIVAIIALITSYYISETIGINSFEFLLNFSCYLISIWMFLRKE